MLMSQAAQAQRSSEDAVAEALDAFGTGVGRETIGLYSAGNARGFSPIQAGNLRIEGLYFDTVGGFPFSFLPSRVVRGYAVHVGVAAQGYLLPAPTGVVDYQLRVPGNEPLASVLVGYATYGVAYEETDVQLPLIRDVLSMGGGVGYTRNLIYQGAANSDDWTFGWTARWQPTENLEITPFWDYIDHREYGEKAEVFIDDSGYPRYHSQQPAALPWTGFHMLASQFGTVARLRLGEGWQLTAGVFRSAENIKVGYFTLLENVDSRGVGDFSITDLPPTSSGSTSGEIRLSKLFRTGALVNTLYLRLTGRDSSIESAPGDTNDLGQAAITQVPLGYHLQFGPSPITDVRVHQMTPGLAYKGVWPGHAELTLGLQKVDYDRSVLTPGTPTASDHSAPWLYSAAATISITPTLLAYGSYTQGFEETWHRPVQRREPQRAGAGAADTASRCGVSLSIDTEAAAGCRSVRDRKAVLQSRSQQCVPRGRQHQQSRHRALRRRRCDRPAEHRLGTGPDRAEGPVPDWRGHRAHQCRSGRSGASSLHHRHPIPPCRRQWTHSRCHRYRRFPRVTQHIPMSTYLLSPLSAWMHVIGCGCLTRTPRSGYRAITWPILMACTQVLPA